MKLYIFILISFFGITNLISLNEEEDKIAFCKNILDNPNSLIEIVKHSVFYDSNSFANIFKYYNYQHKYIKEFIQKYSQFDKFVIQSNISNIDELTNTRVHTISFYYPGVENGIDFLFGEYDDKWKLINIYYNGYDINYEVDMFYNKISIVFAEIKSNPDSLNEIIDRNDLFCKYKLGSDTNYSTRHYINRYNDSLSIEMLKKNRNNTFSIIEISKGWEYTKQNLWTDIELIFDSSKDKIKMQVSYYNCFPCIWQMEFDEP